LPVNRYINGILRPEYLSTLKFWPLLFSGDAKNKRISVRFKENVGVRHQAMWEFYITGNKMMYCMPGGQMEHTNIEFFAPS
jgi:hypothetical protein